MAKNTKLTGFYRLCTLLCLFSGGAGAMQYYPYPNCTGTQHMDKMTLWVWFDEGMPAEEAPYADTSKFTWFPGTCLMKEVRYQSYYDKRDTFVTRFTRTPSPLVLTSEHFTESGGFTPGGDTILGTSWYNRNGVLDSSAEISYDDGARTVSMVRNIRQPGYLISTIQDSTERHGVEIPGYRDSVVFLDSGLAIYSTGWMDSSITQCVRSGDRMVCTPTSTAKGLSPRLLRSEWFAPGGRLDSVRYYDLAGKLIKTAIAGWSPAQAGIKPDRTRPGQFAARLLPWHFGIDGRFRPRRPFTDYSGR